MEGLAKVQKKPVQFRFFLTRAKELASHCLGNERILFTTFTENLAADIQDNLRKICTPDVMKHIEVVHLDQWVNRYLRAHDYPYSIVYGDPIEEIWKKAEIAAGEDFDMPDGFFQEEWETVVQAQNIQSIAEYVKAPRPGRGIRLDRKRRMQVWKVFEEYRAMMDAEKICDSACAMNECAQLLTSGPEVRLYKSVRIRTRCWACSRCRWKPWRTAPALLTRIRMAAITAYTLIGSPTG